MKLRESASRPVIRLSGIAGLWCATVIKAKENARVAKSKYERLERGNYNFRTIFSPPALGNARVCEKRSR